jgi:hypothetical protein
MFDVEIITSVDKFEKLIPEWRKFIGSGVASVNLFQDPDFIRKRLKAEKNSISILFIIFRKSKTIRCIAPLYILKTNFDIRFSVLKVVKFPIKLMKIFGDDIVIWDNESKHNFYQLIFKTLQLFSNLFDIFRVDCMLLHGALWNYFVHSNYNSHGFKMKLSGLKMQKSYQLTLEGNFNDYLRSMRRKTRYNLKREVRIFSKFCDDNVKVEKITQPDHVTEFLTNVDKIFRNTWQADTYGYYRRNSDISVDLLKNFSQKGWLRSYILKCCNDPVAFLIGYQYEDKYYYEDPGFDKNWSKFSPGSVLNYYILEDIYKENKPHCLDFGFGDNQYKRVLGNQENDASVSFIVQNWTYGWLIVLFQRLLDYIYGLTHFVLVRCGLDKRIRSLLKHRT